MKIEEMCRMQKEMSEHEQGNQSLLEAKIVEVRDMLHPRLRMRRGGDSLLPNWINHRYFTTQTTKKYCTAMCYKLTICRVISFLVAKKWFLCSVPSSSPL